MTLDLARILTYNIKSTRHKRNRQIKTIKIKSCASNDTIKKVKRQFTEWEENISISCIW